MYYRSFEGGFSAQTPDDFKRLYRSKSKRCLASQGRHKDQTIIKDTFKAQELENIKELYQRSACDRRQTKAFYVTAADIAGQLA